MATKDIGIGVIGVGMGANVLPINLDSTSRLQVRAVCAQSAVRAQRLADQWQLPFWTTDYRKVIERPDIDVVAVYSPDQLHIEHASAALRAGKHVISEKPIAPDSTTAQRLIALHADRPAQVWMVGENWRYEEAFERAAYLIAANAIGRPVTAAWSRFAALKPGNPYYATTWRRSGFTGGLLLDGVIHLAAALRLVLGEVASVVSMVEQVAPDLPPADTLAAVLRFASGAICSLQVSYAVDSPWGAPLTIIGTEGSLRVDRGFVEIARPGVAVERIECGKLHGVQRELLAFVDAIQHGTPHRNAPAEGLRDLVVVEALLAAATRPGVMVDL